MDMKPVTVSPWTGETIPDEDQIRRLMAGEGLRPYSWSNGPHDIYTAHQHAYHKVIFVVRGSIEFGLPERGESIRLATGDRLDLPAGVVHDARVGPNGVLCLEAHR